MMRITHFQGEGYTLTLIRIPKHKKSRGINRSTVEARDLAGKVFDTWKCEDRKWQHPIHGKADDIAEIQSIYSAIDISSYIQENSNGE